MRLVGKAHGNPVALERPNLLDEPVIQFLVPLSREEGENLCPAREETQNGRAILAEISFASFEMLTL